MSVPDKFTLPDPVLLLFKVKKRIEETEGAKYFQLRVFKKYKVISHLEFEDGRTTNNLEQSKDYPMWYLVKMYIPLSSETTIVDKAYGVSDRVGVRVPSKAIVEIETPKLSQTVSAPFLEYSKSMAKFNFKIEHTKNGKFFYLTNRNWDVITNEPRLDSFEVTLD